MEYIITCEAMRERQMRVKSNLFKFNNLIIGIKKQASSGIVNKRPPIAKDSKM